MAFEMIPRAAQCGVKCPRVVVIFSSLFPIVPCFLAVNLSDLWRDRLFNLTADVDTYGYVVLMEGSGKEYRELLFRLAE